MIDSLGIFPSSIFRVDDSETILPPPLSTFLVSSDAPVSSLRALVRQSSRASRLARVLILALLGQNSRSQIALGEANTILEIVRLWDVVYSCCKDVTLLASIPSSILTVLARCAGVFLHPKCCLCSQFYFMVACPSVICLSPIKTPQGWLADSSLLPMVTALQTPRYVYFSLEAGIPLPCFRLFSFFLRKQRRTVFYFIRDSPQVAQCSPIRFAAPRCTSGPWPSQSRCSH